MILLNGIKLDFETFPNGETKVDGDQLTSLSLSLNKLIFKYENDNDLLKLVFVKRYLDDLNKMTALTILYMPYSRMDRKEGNSVFTLKYVADFFINPLNFTSVEIVEPHSDVTMALINKSYATFPSINLLDKVIEDVGFDKKIDYLFLPDSGAAKRYSKLTGYHTLMGYKERDFATGQIKSLEVIGSKDLSESKVIIVDDLCSYGGTFLAAGEALKRLGAQEIYLLVAHCENSIFKGKLLLPDSPINKIFTTNSILDANTTEFLTDGKIQVFDVI